MTDESPYCNALPGYLLVILGLWAGVGTIRKYLSTVREIYERNQKPKGLKIDFYDVYNKTFIGLFFVSLRLN